MQQSRPHLLTMKKLLVCVIAVLALPILSFHFFTAGAASDLFAPEGEDEMLANFADFLKPVTILSPYQNQILDGMPRKVGLGWQALGDAVSYDIELACEKCDLSKEPWSKSVVKRIEYYTHWITPALAQDGHYRVRIRGVAQNGWVGPWSNYRYFTYNTKPVLSEVVRKENKLLTIPTILTPAKDEAVNAAVLSWNEVAGADRYEVQLACDTCLSTNKWLGATKFVMQNHYFMPANLQAGYEYGYRVRTLDTTGAASSWSELRYFTVAK